jgi:hypothetical protein
MDVYQTYICAYYSSGITEWMFIMAIPSAIIVDLVLVPKDFYNSQLEVVMQPKQSNRNQAVPLSTFFW